MKKIGVLLTALALLLAALCGCSGNKEAEKAAEFDAEAAFARLLTEVAFGSELEDNSAAAEFFFSGLPEYEKISFYTSSDSSSEDMLLFVRLKNEADVSSAEEAVNAYLAQRKTEAGRYHAGELPKLENAVVKTAGTALIVCVTGDPAAANAILNG